LHVIQRHVSINNQEHLSGHIVCIGRCGLLTAYFTEINENEMSD